MKALKILKEIEEHYNLILARELATRKPVKKTVDKDVQTIIDKIEELSEAIGELKELQKINTCIGCKWEGKSAALYPCMNCIRSVDTDHYERKEK